MKLTRSNYPGAGRYFLGTSLLFSLTLLLVLVLGGCGLVGGSTESPRKSRQALANAEIQSLRKNNTEMRHRQEKALQQMASLQKQIAAEQAENRRFREMMATNFDLLEQSVALSLSKSARETPVVEPSELNLPERPAVSGNSAPQPGGTALSPPGMRISPPAAMAPPAGEPPAGRGGSPRPAASARPALPYHALSFNSGGDGSSGESSSSIAAPAAASKGGIMTVAAREPNQLDDPDLKPPANPRKLRAHMAAKPLYEKGFRHYARKNYSQAILVYRDFLVRYPEDIYADNAQFWIAESYFRQGKFADAEKAYRSVLRNYEHRSSLEGFKTPEAIYRIGLTFLKRKDKNRARYYFASVAEKFPKSSAGRRAEKELASMQANTAQTAGPATTPDS